MQTYHVIGLMSGTSLDGLDLARCRFDFDGGRWRYAILEAVTYAYDEDWKNRLSGLFQATAVDYARTHAGFGRYCGRLVTRFLEETATGPADFVASHGHTVFHRPAEGFTSQVGEGAALAAACGLPVVCDFRTTDVALGGQGAPLVPVGDRLLFSEYSYCLNLGGIANISYEAGGRRIAYDVCPCNLLLDFAAAKAGKAYDEDGRLAASGSADAALLAALDNLPFYQKAPPKSLGREELEADFLPVIEQAGLPPADLLHTLCIHIAGRIAAATKQAAADATLLITGGGAFHRFLVDAIRRAGGIRVHVPDEQTVKYKEALIFALLGVLRMRTEANGLSAVTGASRDSCGGAVYLP